MLETPTEKVDELVDEGAHLTVEIWEMFEAWADRLRRNGANEGEVRAAQTVAMANLAATMLVMLPENERPVWQMRFGALVDVALQQAGQPL